MTDLCRRNGVYEMKYNEVTMRGRLGHEPELRKTTTGKSVTNASIAVYAGKDAEGNTKSNWYQWTIWGKKAEDFCLYAHKGDSVTFEGHASTEQRKTKGGELYTQVVFTADDYELKQKQNRVQEAPLQEEEYPF